MKEEDVLYRDIIESIDDGVYFVDTHHRITYWNSAAERITGFDRDSVMGKRCADGILAHVDGDGVLLCGERCPLMEVMQTCERRETEVFMHHKEGHRVPVRVQGSPIQDPQGKIIGAVEVFRDMTHERASQQMIEQLKRDAFLCPLTGISNRRHIELSLASQFEEFERYGYPFGLLFVDIDHFKRFNDEYGHDVGDSVLKMVAKTLANGVRPLDRVGRWGGEEFVVIVANIDSEAPVIVAERCRALIENSYLLEADPPQKVTISIGAARVRKGETLQDLVARADSLMYASKEAGRNRVTPD